MSASLPQMAAPQRQSVPLSETELNTNEIVGKLVQIRDFIKQVTATMAQLESIGGQAAREKIERLHNVWMELVDNEQRLVGLLQRFSVVQHEQNQAACNNSDNESNASPHPVANVNGASDVSEESDDEDDEDDDEDKDNIDGLEAANEMSLRKRNELLAKVAESQEKLKSLQDQQTLLLSLQHQAESRLTEARSFHDHLITKSSANDNQPLTTEEVNTSVVLERELENIEHRLASLQNMYTNRDKIDVMVARPADGSNRGASREELFEASQQKDLQDKLHELQNKKKQMDDLVKELALLRESRILDSHSSHDGNDDCEGNNDPRTMVVTREKIAAAKQTLNGVDTNEKTRKLEEMKAWLRTLQDMVSNLSPEHQDPMPGASNHQAAIRGKNEPANVDEHARALPQENVQEKYRKTKKSKTNNLSRELSNEFVLPKLSSSMVASNTSHHFRQNSHSDELSIDVQDPEVMEKVRKLHEAKAKLEMLHGLLNVVQNSQQTGQSLNVEYAEHLLNSIDSADGGDDLALNLVQPMISDSAFTVVPPGRLRNERDVAARPTRKQPIAKVSSKPLMLPSSQSRVPQRQSVDYSRPTDMETASCRKTNVVSAADPNEVEKLHSSNQELWLEMRHQMALQEELRQRRRELESLMKKDGGGKNYLLNQDNRSENLSASAKSEPLLAVAAAASVGATDGTSAATWGGSSLDNGARETVDGNASQEETNERMIDEDFSSEEGAELANAANAMEAMVNDAPSLKTMNQIAASNHGLSDGPWGVPETHRQSLGSNTGDPSMGMAAFITSLPNFSKTSWSQSDRQHSQAPQDNVDVNIQEERYGHDASSLPFPLNIPLQSNTMPIQHQMESTSMLYQAILRDQHVLSGLVQQSPNSVPLPTMVVSDVLQANHGNLVQQQLLLGLSHCYHLLYLQHLEMQRLQQNFQNSASCSDSHSANRSQPRANSCDASDALGAAAQPQWHLDNPSVARLSVSSSSSLHPPPLPPPPKLQPPPSHHQHQQLPLPQQQQQPHHQQQQHPLQHRHDHYRHDLAHGPTNETLNNQVPPGNRANNYWDNFRSYSRQNLLSNTAHVPTVPHPNKSNDCPGGASGGVGGSSGGHCQSLPRLGHGVAAVANLRRRSHGNSGGAMSHLGSQSPDIVTFRAEGATGGSGDVQSRAADNLPRSSHSTTKPLHEATAVQNSPKDKINKDLGSLGQNSYVLKNHGNTSPINSHNSTTSCRGFNRQPQPAGRLVKVPTKDGWNKTNSSVRQRCTESDGCSLSIPPQLAENSVQSEVSRLVSQLNVDPQSLIRLLQELQNLNSEESVRQALIALREASVGGPLYNDVDSGMGLNRFPLPHRQDSRGSAPGVSRQYQRGRISSSSSDGEDIRTFSTKTKKFSRQNHPNAGLPSDPGPSSAVSGRFGSCSSLESSVLSPLGEGHGDILSQNMLPRKPPMNYRKMEMSNLQTTLDFPSHVSSSSTMPESSSAEKTASSLTQKRGNENSEMSNSDVPSGRFNVQQLEKQMQAIMLSIASFVASFSHNICNPKYISAIISHIMALVLPLVQSVNQDTVNFLPSQLSCVLDNILQKYIHKRFGDVEDALLCELSEVLFNELAFLQLMQNLDGCSAQQRSQKFHSLAEKFYLLSRNGNSGSNACHGGASAADLDMRSATMPGTISHCDGGHSEATDADLAVMARHGDDEDNDKAREDFSCDIPDVCAMRMAPGALGPNLAGDEPSFFRTSPSHNIPHNLDSHPNSPLPLPDLGALGAAAEGQGEMHYFDREAEIEGDLGDTQDLAEADQSQGYMEAESALDDVQGEEGSWGIDHNLINGGIDRTEDDQHDEDEPLGAAGGGPNFVSRDQMDGERSGPEIGLDEVPIKLREGSASGNAQARNKDENQPDQSDSHDSCKGKNSNDHVTK